MKPQNGLSRADRLRYTPLCVEQQLPPSHRKRKHVDVGMAFVVAPIRMPRSAASGRRPDGTPGFISANDGGWLHPPNQLGVDRPRAHCW